jgi:hypothetical protein
MLHGGTSTGKLVGTASMKQVKSWFRSKRRRGNGATSEPSPTEADLASDPPFPALLRASLGSKSDSESPNPMVLGKCFGHWCNCSDAHCHISADEIPPWVEWQLDNGFLKELDQWNNDNPESKLSVFAEKLQDKLTEVGTVIGSDTVKDLLKLIPDTPFPAGSLIRSLVNVLLVGIVS